MAITRVQSVSAAYQAGGSGVIDLILSTPPTKGNTFFLALTSTAELDIGTISHPGVTNWTRVNPPIDHSGSPSIRIEMWQAQDVGNAAGDTVQVLLSDAFESCVAILVEYEDILRFGTIVDVQNSSDGSSNITDSGSGSTTQAEELWFAITSNLQGNSQQQIPTNGFTEIDQLATGLSASDLNFGVYEKIVSSTGTANTALTLSSSQSWVAAIYALKEDVSVEHQITPGVDVVVAELYDIGTFLSVVAAEENLMPLNMSMDVKGLNELVTANLGSFIVPEPDSGEKIALLEVMIHGSTIISRQAGAFVDMWIDASDLLFPPPSSEDGTLRSALQILLDGQTWPFPVLPTPGDREVNAGLDLAIDGDSSVADAFDYTSLLDIYIIGERQLTATLEIFRVLVFDRDLDLDVHIGAQGPTAQRIRSGMDVAVLPLTVLSNITTTPDGSQYGNCRSLWQAVPKQTKLHAQLGVSINDFVVFTRSSTLGVLVDPSTFVISDANAAQKRFFIAGDVVSSFPAFTGFTVWGSSTGNDGTYLVDISGFSGGFTYIQVLDVIFDAGGGRISVP